MQHSNQRLEMCGDDVAEQAYTAYYGGVSTYCTSRRTPPCRLGHRKMRKMWRVILACPHRSVSSSSFERGGSPAAPMKEGSAASGGGTTSL
jgi:hypothetical protein